MRAPFRAWRPVPSLGVWLGVAITVLAVACTAVLLAADAATSSTPTRVACTVGAFVGLALCVAAGVGTWWRSTLSYVLGPTALEVRYGSSRLRVRYDEIDEVRGRGEEPSPPPTLWPGAHFGWRGQPEGGAEVWRASAPDPRHAVVVVAGAAGFVVTPQESGSFREELIENARSAAYAGSGTHPSKPAWLDRLAMLDGWARLLLVAAGVVATVGIALDVARFGASQPDGTGAASILLVNAAAALALSVRWPAIARLLAAGALAAQVFALA